MIGERECCLMVLNTIRNVRWPTALTLVYGERSLEYRRLWQLSISSIHRLIILQVPNNATNPNPRSK